MPLDDSTRCLRRTWIQNSSSLPKYSSLPELQLAAKERECRQCGLTMNPLCLWCTWACKEANHGPKTSIPRARRVSAPPRVFIRIDLSPSSGKFTLLADNHENIDSVAPSNQTKTNVNSTSSPINPLVHHALGDVNSDVYYHRINPLRGHIKDIDIDMVNDPVPTRELHPVPGAGGVAVAAATRSSSPSFTQTRTVTIERVEHNPEENNSARTKTESLTLTAEGLATLLRLENVDHSHSDPTIMKPSLALKVSRGSFTVGCADKIPLHLDDAHELAKNFSLSHDETTPSPPRSPKHQHFRPLRRKKHLNIIPSNVDSDAPEPIAISLNIHHPSPPPATPSHLIKKASQILTDYISPHPHTRTHSHSQSIVASLSSGGTADPVTPPMTPTHQRSPPSSAPPKMKSAGATRSSSPESSPVRLGHPSRPYYNAIRKNGVSPPPARLRPQSQPPPSSYPLGFDLTPSVETPEPTTSASRHLSMSAMLASPPAFSALSLSDDDHDNNDNDFEVHPEPTNSARLSLSSSFHRLSFNSHTQSRMHHTHSQSLSRAKGVNSNRSNGLGCSMSGETELRMALATSSPSGVATLGRTQGGFRFRETVVPSENNSDNVGSTNAEAGYLRTRNVRSRNSFMCRVKKLRKGLTEMLMNKNTTTTTTATT